MSTYIAVKVLTVYYISVPSSLMYNIHRTVQLFIYNLKLRAVLRVP